jgi:glycolate oxidase FAD binding subunit
MRPSLRQSLAKIAGDDRVATVESSPTLVRALGGTLPSLAIAPRTPEQVAALLALAAEHGLGVIVYGTELGCGAPPQKADLFLDLRGLDSALELEPGDLTVRASSGVRFERLQTALAQHGQRVALDSPAPHATLLDLAITRSCGPLRHAHGTMRDHVLGLSVATPDGRITRSGGRVVKNVTGYDLMKLHVGALATLGVIVELNLRVQPQPEHRLLLLGRFPDAASACGFANAVRLDRGLAPAALEIVSDLEPISAMPENGLAVAVLFEGSESAVEAQLEAAQAHLRDRALESAEVFARAELKGLLDHLTQARMLDVSNDDLLALRATVAPSRLHELVPVLLAGGLRERARRLISWAGLGIVDLMLHGDLMSDASLPDEVATLTQEVRTLGGEVHLRAAPRFVWATFQRPVSEGAMALERALRSALDPRQVLNPGRLPGLP